MGGPEVPVGQREVDPALRVVVAPAPRCRTRCPASPGRARPRSRSPAAGRAAAASSSPGGICGNQPSASRAMRRTTFSTTAPTNEPIQIGIGRCTGIGFRPMRSRWCQRPSKVTSSSDQRRRSTSTCSSTRAPRFEKSSLSASYSIQFRPTPTPRRSRPPVSRSSSAACLATSTVWRCGRIRMRGDELQVPGDRAEEAEQHERLVVRDVVGVDLLARAAGRGGRR